MFLKVKATLCESPAVVTDWKILTSLLLYGLEARLAVFGKIIRSESFKYTCKSDFYMEATRM